MVANVMEENGVLWGTRAKDWASIQEPAHRQLYAAVLDALEVGNGSRFADLGCGAGMTLEMAADSGAKTTGVDASANLLEIARQRVPLAALHQADLQALPLEDDAFDVVAGINAFQYASQPRKALEEAARIVRPDGLVAIVTWGSPDRMEAARLIAAIKPLLPPPPPGAAGPFALSDPDTLRDLAKSAGLAPVDLLDIDAPFEYPDLATGIRGLCSAGVAVKAMQFTSQEAVANAYSNALAAFERSNGSVSVQASFRCLLARAPR